MLHKKYFLLRDYSHVLKSNMQVEFISELIL